MTMNQVDEAAAERKLGMDPMLQKSYREILADIPKRILLLVSKAISIKVAVFGVFVWLFIRQDVDLPAWILLSVAGFVIFGREFLKFMKEIKP
jgi:hypothetical protein